MISCCRRGYELVSPIFARVDWFSSRHDASRHERPHFRDAARLQDACAGFKCRPRRAHIVDQHHDRAAKPRGGPRAGEGVAHVAMTLGSRQAGLRGGCLDASQGVTDGKAQAPCQVARLVEAALAASRRVQRHRHHPCGALQDLGTSFAHQRGKRDCQRSAAVVLQRVHDGAQHAVVDPHRTGTADGRGKAPATAAALRGERRRTPRAERVAAAIAQRRRQWQDCPPARGTHGAGGGVLERALAHRAERRQNNGKERIEECPGPGRRPGCWATTDGLKETRRQRGSCRLDRRSSIAAGASLYPGE